MPEIAPRLRQTEEYYFSRKLRELEQMNREGEKVINLGIGSPDLPHHPEVVETLCHSAGQSNVNGYQSYRSAERRVGKECVSSCRSRWWPNHYKKKIIKQYTNT